MAGDALKAAVAGKTVFLDTPIGALPINYRQNGTMSGYSKALGVYVGTDRDSGRWWVLQRQALPALVDVARRRHPLLQHAHQWPDGTLEP